MGGEGSGDTVGHEFRGNEYTNAMAAIKQTAERAIRLEAGFTKDILDISSETGGHVPEKSLNFKTKTEQSIIKKVVKVVYKDKITPEAALEKMTDLNRYTITYPNDENFSDNVNSAQEALEAKGYKQYKDKYKIYTTGNYRGYNTVMIKGTDKVEIQFHTKESYILKEGLHKLYDTYENPDSDMLTRYNAQKKMVGLQSKAAAFPEVTAKKLKGRVV